MISKKRFSLIALFTVLIFVLITCTGRGHSYKVELFKSENGWGYDILVNNKPYIHQPYIPAIEGQIPFSDKQSARKTACFVVDKLQNHKSPAITKDELNKILKN